MTSYPTVSSHYSNNTQDQAYHDPPQFYNPHPPHDTYDQSGYREPEQYQDEPSYSLPQGPSTEPLGMNTKEEPSDYVDEFNPTPREPRPPRSLRAWRYQQGRRLWTQGSRPRCLCRFFCCTVFVTLFLVAGIVLALALWIRPPDVIVGSDNSTSPAVAQGVNLLTDGFQINLGLPIEVVNPNYFSARLTHVDAQLFYPINNTLVGNGTVNNVVLPSSSTTNFTFPFALVYTTSIDPTFAIITDIAEKCNSSQSDLTIRYKITIGVRIFFVTISPSISNTLSFTCPISESDLQVRLLIPSISSFNLTIFCFEQSLLKSLGVNPT
ncbi:hypothetical protein DFH94DRAFT_55927 [Russula ochroleuca]|uniref:Late embryogenesis abundant protein LEA-2 subgroup domain-containing protein n=1 Tax=Russula ochroleuca TaxID=152965 RepID=A0A9P5T6W8_9AGAM|nr:hypothetical protein DFH94DRAFT_55927 [Russula ochroleuca]